MNSWPPKPDPRREGGNLPGLTEDDLYVALARIAAAKRAEADSLLFAQNPSGLIQSNWTKAPKGWSRYSTVRVSPPQYQDPSARKLTK